MTMFALPKPVLAVIKAYQDADAATRTALARARDREDGGRPRPAFSRARQDAAKAAYLTKYPGLGILTEASPYEAIRTKVFYITTGTRRRAGSEGSIQGTDDRCADLEVQSTALAILLRAELTPETFTDMTAAWTKVGLPLPKEATR